MPTRTDSKVKVLVVDDDRETTSICEGLNTEKHQIEVSERAADGLERLNRADNYDIVVVDYQLDEGTAIEFIAKAKQIRPDIPYLVWSVSSSDEIKRSLPSFDLTVFETGIAGFRQKRDVQSSARLMASFLEEAEIYYRLQVYKHLKPVLFSAFRQLEIALNHTKSVSRMVDSFNTQEFDPLTKPATFRLNHVEAILRQLLGYGTNNSFEDRSGARLALEQMLTRNAVGPVPSEVHAAIERFVRSAENEPDSRATIRLRRSLERRSYSIEAQRAVAVRTAEIVEFLIYSGARRQAKTLSAEIWQHANSHWSDAAKFSCGISHAHALAAAGSPSLAEHLVASMLVQAELVYPKRNYDELARSVFAEFEHFSAEARSA